MEQGGGYESDLGGKKRGERMEKDLLSKALWLPCEWEAAWKITRGLAPEASKPNPDWGVFYCYCLPPTKLGVRACTKNLKDRSTGARE